MYKLAKFRYDIARKSKEMEYAEIRRKAKELDRLSFSILRTGLISNYKDIKEKVSSKSDAIELKSMMISKICRVNI
mgnify:CR=1 FL=1|tara:strand:- start:459 stop:686 length:228 start_codon:yes stop_codon:yes gene_type:complete